MIRYSYYKEGVLTPVAYFDIEETAEAALPGLTKIAGEEELICDNPGYAVEFPEDAEIVVVYFETGCHADKVAIFAEESQYDECLDGLTKLAKKHRMQVTESVCPEEEDWREPLWSCINEKLNYEKEYGKKGWMKSFQKIKTGGIIDKQL